MRLRNKVLLTILLAVGWWAILQHCLVSREKTDGCLTQVTQAQLLTWYKEANTAYFDDRLPKDTVVVWESLRGIKAMGDTGCNDQGCKIRIDPFVNIAPATTQETLFHEMCHIETKGETLDHGPAFQNCIIMLFKKGALEGLI